MDQNKSLRGVAEAVARIMMGEKALHPNQQKLDVHEPEKDELTSDDFKKLRSMKKEEIEDVSEMDYGGGKSPYAGHGLSRDDDDDGKKELTAKVTKSGNVVKSALDILNKQSVNKKDMKKEEVDLDEGKMAQLDADLKDLSHADFHKEYGKPKSHYDPSNFKKPVQKGKEMDRVKSLAQRAMASMKKEEVEEVDEGIMDKVKGIFGKKEKSTNLFDQPQVKKDTAAYLKASAKNPNGPPVRNLMAKEEVEEIEEMFPGTPEYEKKYGKAPQDMKPGEKKKTTKGEMEKTEKGVVHKRKFSEMLDVYSNGNLKSLFEALDEKEEIIVEEPTNDEFKAELKKAIDKSLGKDKAKVADPAVQAVQKEEVEQIEERQLSSGEKAEKEKNVKGMKKNLQGFKDRYGDRAKEVMYATATVNAKKSS